MKKQPEVINADNIEITYVPINDIKPYSDNPKLHSAKDIDKLMRSMTAVRGRIVFHQPIVLDKKNVVIAGHGRRLAALQLGLTHVPCTYLDVSESDAIALRLADNDAFGLDYDMTKMDQELEKLNESQKDHLGYVLPSVEEMIKEVTSTQNESRARRKTSVKKDVLPDDNYLGDKDDDFDDEQEDEHPKEKRLETVLCEDLAEKFKGVTEVKTPIGYIDIMTDHQIIEVKRVRKWKWALGQILVYGLYHPNHEKRIHLFGRCKESKLEMIKEHCANFNVVVTWQYEEFRP